MIFRPLHFDHFVTYVQCFDIVPQQGIPNNINSSMGMHLVRRATKPNGSRIGNVIPVTWIRSPAHLIPNFGKEAHACLTGESSYEFSTEFWLNKFWTKEFYYILRQFLSRNKSVW